MKYFILVFLLSAFSIAGDHQKFLQEKNEELSLFEQLPVELYGLILNADPDFVEYYNVIFKLLSKRLSKIHRYLEKYKFIKIPALKPSAEWLLFKSSINMEQRLDNRDREYCIKYLINYLSKITGDAYYKIKETLKECGEYITHVRHRRNYVVFWECDNKRIGIFNAETSEYKHIKVEDDVDELDIVDNCVCYSAAHHIQSYCLTDDNPDNKPNKISAINEQEQVEGGLLFHYNNNCYWCIAVGISGNEDGKNAIIIFKSEKSKFEIIYKHEFYSPDDMLIYMQYKDGHVYIFSGAEIEQTENSYSNISIIDIDLVTMKDKLFPISGKGQLKINKYFFVNKEDGRNCYVLNSEGIEEKSIIYDKNLIRIFHLDDYIALLFKDEKCILDLLVYKIDDIMNHKIDPNIKEKHITFAAFNIECDSGNYDKIKIGKDISKNYIYFMYENKFYVFDIIAKKLVCAPKQDGQDFKILPFIYK